MASALKRLTSGVAINALFGYHVGGVLLGFLVHPYKTVQDMVRKRIPTPILFFPSLCWIAGFIVLRVTESLLWSFLPYLGMWLFLFVWGTFFLLFWQILLLYLYLRFSRVLS